MSCPNRCSNDFKVKNFPDEIECVIANKMKTNELAVRGPSNAFIVSASDIVDSSSNIPFLNTAAVFTGTVLDSDNNPVESGTVLKIQNEPKHSATIADPGIYASSVQPSDLL